MNVRMTRSDFWRQRYRQRPYLRLASDEELAQRFRDVMKNTLLLTAKGQIGVVGRENAFWWELMTHLFEEYGNRGGIPINLASKDTVPNATYPDEPKATKALSGVKLPSPTSCLIKFGKREHLQPMISDGVVRISPASYYSDPSLNAAQQDDELSIHSYAMPDEVTANIIDTDTLKPKGTIKPRGNVKFTIRANQDYYVYCLAHTLDIRLFDDFEADSCIIIRQPAAFKKKLISATSKKLPRWADWDQMVRYIDPHNSRRSELEVYFSKNFRYWYQREYRFAWINPSANETPLEPFFVELGPLAGIAELICL